MYEVRVIGTGELEMACATRAAAERYVRVLWEGLGVRAEVVAVPESPEDRYLDHVDAEIDRLKEEAE